jgi:hypothetical protein
MRAVRAVAASFGIMAATVTMAAAQGQSAPKPSGSVPLRMQLLISRYQGDRRISATPYTFVVNATDLPGQQDWSRIRMGVEVPVIAPPPPPEGKQNDAAPPPKPVFQYRPFGTNIDCIAQPLDGGRFKVSITIDESTPYSDQDQARFPSPNNENRAGMNPVFRSFRLANVLLLKDGQSEQMSSATDRFSGEIVKVDVTLSVIKP